MSRQDASLASALAWPRFDFSRVRLGNLADRGHKLTADQVLTDLFDDEYLTATAKAVAKLSQDDPLRLAARSMRRAARENKPLVWFLGGHPVKLGLSPILIDLVRRGWVSHLAANGAFAIHDFELSVFGGTSEDVALHLPAGRFGLWRESSRINDVIRDLPDSARPHIGLGAAVGIAVWRQGGRGDLSVAAACVSRDIPVTIHLAIGQDITHTHANFSGSGLMEASYVDFSVFCASIASLAGGVFLNVGSAVAGPEVFLKALSATRNVLGPAAVSDFDTIAFDLQTVAAGPVTDVDPAYYFRPWKTILSRSISGSGRSIYVNRDHRDSLPALWYLLVFGEPGGDF